MMINFTKATPDELELVLGREFRSALVLEAGADESGQWMTRLMIDGQAVTLIGNPSDALRTYLAGQEPGRATA
jgi:hypothetical protein